MELDLPVDPNEPTYCYCGQVSYGEMIACDNPEVSINPIQSHPCGTEKCEVVLNLSRIPILTYWQKLVGRNLINYC